MSRPAAPLHDANRSIDGTLWPDALSTHRLRKLPSHASSYPPSMRDLSHLMWHDHGSIHRASTDISPQQRMGSKELDIKPLSSGLKSL